MKAVDEIRAERDAEDELLEACARIIREARERRPNLRIVREVDDGEWG